MVREGRPVFSVQFVGNPRFKQTQCQRNEHCLMACSRGRRDKTRQFCLVRVSGVNKLLHIKAALTLRVASRNAHVLFRSLIKLRYSGTRRLFRFISRLYTRQYYIFSNIKIDCCAQLRRHAQCAQAITAFSIHANTVMQCCQSNIITVLVCYQCCKVIAETRNSSKQL